MKLITIVGARPQFVKAATVCREIADYNKQKGDSLITEVLVHTGQHYDHNMSQVFFDDLKIASPQYNLQVGSGSHGKMTGKMLAGIEEVLNIEKPDLVLVYGDTNSTLAGALAAAKLHIPVAHVEAGLRSFNRAMPEETNRVLTDHISSILFCPTIAAIKNLKREGITDGITHVGDVMYDAFLFTRDKAARSSTILKNLHIKPKKYCLATIHREENTENPVKLKSIFNALEEISETDHPIIIPIHPRTKKIIDEEGIKCHLNPSVLLIPPVSYFDMIVLEDNAKIILTDSGGMQKEAYFAKVPCVTLRDETEWVETVETGSNFLAGADTKKIIESFRIASNSNVKIKDGLYGNGHAAYKIVKNLLYDIKR
jgi:UDP-GlcNAc3NAcA epimerase